MTHRIPEGVFESKFWKLVRFWLPLGFLASREQFLHGGRDFGYPPNIPDFGSNPLNPCLNPEPRLSEPLLPVRFGRVRVGYIRSRFSPWHVLVHSCASRCTRSNPSELCSILV